MIPTSQEFIDAMRAKTITTSAKVEVIDNEYNSGIMIESGNYGLFEGAGIELDGSRCAISAEHVDNYTPRINITTEETVSEGWYSADLSDESGNITTDSYTKVVEHNKKNVSNLHILFTEVREEYPINFSVSINGNVTTYTDNTENEIVIENVATNSTVIINITKWSKAYSRAKILNVYLGTVFQYEDADIVSINGRKGVDLINEEIQSKEIEIKLVDENNAYNIFDENTELTALDNDARIIIHIGVLIGNFIYYVKIDECYFKKIEKQDNELEMIIRGMGVISKYQDIIWGKLYNEIYMFPWTLSRIINGIDNSFTKLKERVHIYPEIINEAQTMLRCADKETRIHEFFNELAINCRSNLVETYDNKINFRRLAEETPVSLIELENMEEYPQIEKQDNKYDVLIKKYDYTISDSQEEVYSGRFKLAGSSSYGYAYLTPYKEVDFLYTDTSQSSFVLNIYNSDGTVYASNVTQMGQYGIDYIILPNTILFVSTNNLLDKTFELKFNCKTLQFSSSDHKIENNATNEEKIIDIRSIQDEDTAQSIGLWLANNLNKRYRFKIKVNDACTYELGDTVRLETGVYQNDEMVIRSAIVVGIEYDYTGTLDYYLVLEGA